MFFFKTGNSVVDFEDDHSFLCIFLRILLGARDVSALVRLKKFLETYLKFFGAR